MRYLLTLLFAMTACGQGLLIDPYRFGSSGPGSLTNLTYWWVHTDIDTNNVIVTNWPARVGSSTFEQAAAAQRPTNTASGVYFGGGTRLTNNPVATINTTAGTQATMWLVLTVETPVSGLGALVADQSGDHGLYTESDDQWSAIFASGGAGNQGSFVSGTTMDLSLVYTNTGINAVYTNVVAMFSLAAAAPYNQNQRYIGADPFGDNFKGRIREFAIFDTALTTNQLGQLHTYATNLYGYSP